MACLFVVVPLTACSDDSADVAPPTPTVEPSGTEAPATTMAPYESPLGDVIGQALVAGQFTVLAGLLVDAGLVDALRAEGPFTVFAPNDAAFSELPASTLDAVFADPALLTAVLTYHVVAGEAISADSLVDGQELTTLQGQTLKVTKSGDKVQINGIDVIATDVPATNGVIHVISGVLVPQS
ncbi:MAG: hypothetical protein RL391_1906 [Actinomycetota bacterium]|jgi:uncharacterized surface protein with fasciclin (FAS1) repeats